MATLAINFKPTDPVSFANAIRKYIVNVYQLHTDPYEQDIAELDRLRSEIASPEPHEASLNLLLKYYGQLSMVCAKLPMDESSIRIPFRWYNSFGSRSRNGPVSSSRLPFEQAHVLFNIGAMYNQLGRQAQSQQQSDGGERIKKAAFYYQMASGVFQEVIERYREELGAMGSREMAPAALMAFGALNLALAQECFCQKAIQDQLQDGKMKDGTISKLAGKCGELFNQAYEQAAPDGSKQVFPSEWLVYLQAKALHYNAIAQHRKANELLQQSKFGEQVARLKIAVDLLKKAMDLQKSLPDSMVSELKAFGVELQAVLKAAEKDNDVVYLEKVPAASELGPLEKVQMVKPTLLASIPTMQTIIGAPLFGKLYPYTVHKEVGAYNDRKQSILANARENLRQLDMDSMGMLQSMGLPGSILAFEQPIGLPAELLKKSQELRSQGGSQSLVEQMQTVTVLAVQNSTLYDEICKSLDEEMREDQEVRDRFKERWTRTASKELQKSMREKLERFGRLMKTAKSSDEIVRKKFETNFPYIESLGATKEELENSIPASSMQTSAAKNDPVVKELKRLLNELSQNQSARLGIFERLKGISESDDIGPALLEAYAKKDVALEKVFDEQLKRYEKSTQEIADNQRQQKSLLDSIRTENERFLQSKQQNQALRERETCLQNLEQGYQHYRTLCDNLQEGVKFYTDLDNELGKLKAQAADFISARSLERKDYLKDLTQQLAQMSVNNSPTVTSPSSTAVHPSPNLPPRPDQYGAPVPGHGGGVWTPAIPLQYQYQQPVPPADMPSQPYPPQYYNYGGQPPQQQPYPSQQQPQQQQQPAYNPYYQYPNQQG